VVESAPYSAIQQASWIIPARLLAIGTPAVFWQWAAAHFNDEIVPDWRRWIVWFGLVGVGAAAMITGQATVWHAVQATTLLLAGLGLWRVLSGRSLDLVESRRRSRIVLATSAALYIAAVNLCFLMPSSLQTWWNGSFVNAAGLAGMAFAFAVLRLLSARDDVPRAAAPAAAAKVLPALLPAGPVIDPSEASWLTSPRTAMERDKAYREEGFSIASLAARLSIPEYRLRHLINQWLGHRNFTAFVNSYRLAEVTAALADPNQADVPILTIALVPASSRSAPSTAHSRPTLA
jgi:hypothetical protein